MVVLLGTALDTICTPLSNFDLLHTNFILHWFPFLNFDLPAMLFIYNNLSNILNNRCRFVYNSFIILFFNRKRNVKPCG